MDSIQQIEILTQYVHELIIEKGHMHYQKELAEYMMRFFEPSEMNKKKYAEVNTPTELRHDMLSKLIEYDLNFFKSKKTIFEPCCGKGLFILDVIDEFMKGLSELYPNINERYRVIVEECIYFADINPVNIDICKVIMDPFSQYQLQYHKGDALEISLTQHFHRDTKFDAVVSNPPYNALGKTATGNAIWQYFVKKALHDWSRGYLVFVHPPGWRKPPKQDSKYTGLFDDLTNKNHMLYLEMHDIKDGLRVFGCGTRYDWYIVKLKPYITSYINESSMTKVKDYKGNVMDINLMNFYFLPNYNINEVQKYCLSKNDSSTPINVLYSRTSYASDKSWVTDYRNDEYCFPIIHSTPKSGTRYLYSKKDDNGHFYVPKIIFGDSGINNVVIDELGQYGMSEHAIGFTGYNTIHEMNTVKKILESSEFTEQVLKPCMWSNYQIDWRLFTYIKRDFHKCFPS